LLLKSSTETDLKILLTILACIIVGSGAAVAFIYSGLYDVSALQPDAPLVNWALHTTSDRSVDARLAGISVPAGLDQPQTIRSGGHRFAQNCAVCHGGPGLKPTYIAQGLNPQPPNLFRANRKPWPEEMFRFIKYGVKMTAMPGFGKTLSDQEIWELVAFLRTAPGLSPQDFAVQTGINGSVPVEPSPRG
jgi:mono/diheme cytochrome c family protein